MTAITRLYNLARLGKTGDTVELVATDEERTALAAEAELLSVPEFSARIVLRKISADRFALDYALRSSLVQACVVSLEPVTARIDRDFTRELQHKQHLKRVSGEVVITPEDDGPEEIESLHFDLGGPLIEEFLLGIDPYPRAPGVEFQPPEGMDAKPESPFAVLKGLKSPG